MIKGFLFNIFNKEAKEGSSKKSEREREKEKNQ